ncbi:MAG: HAD-IIIA family hydrolase [Armatimonadota bacterium]|nr:HAD-IIIA family hydrolase [Armatimonadota bacterium]
MEREQLQRPAPPSLRRAVFLDRDGVLCENSPAYVKTWAEFRWLPGSKEALRLLAALRLPVVLVTNQSAINRGMVTGAEVARIHARMRAQISRAGGRLDGIYLCPHRPEEGCRCRKPGTLLFRQAAAELGLKLGGSYLVGDSRADLEAGWRLGMQVILVQTGLGSITAAELDGNRAPVQIVPDFLAAARWISSREMSSRQVGAPPAASPRVSLGAEPSGLVVTGGES